MNSFKTKYPSFSALIALAASIAQDFTAGGLTLIQKLTGLAGLLPQVLAFIPLAGGLASELVALKAAPADIEAGAEVLVTDLAFSSVKAKAIVSSAFPVAEGIANLVSPAQSLIAAIRS